MLNSHNRTITDFSLMDLNQPRPRKRIKLYLLLKGSALIKLRRMQMASTLESLSKKITSLLRDLGNKKQISLWNPMTSFLMKPIKK